MDCKLEKTIDWQSMELFKSDKYYWIAPVTKNPYELVVPGTTDEPDSESLLLAKEIAEKIDELKQNAITLIKSLAKDHDECFFEGIEVLKKTDMWGANYILSFSTEDYVGIYVGFNENDQPFYVLQRIE